MESNQEENLDSQNEEQEEETQDNQEEVVEKKEEYSDNEKRLYERAKKAEEEVKRLKADKKPQTEVKTELSQTDVIFLAKADIHEDDIEYITTLAKNNGLSVKDAVAQFKPMLDVRNEERRTAQATETSSGRGKKPKTGEDLLRKANETGEVPTDDKGMQDLILARQNRFKRK